VKQKKDGIFISQDKYVAKILRKFGLSEEKYASTPIGTEKPLLKDPDGKPHLDLWYPKDLPFDLVAYSDSDYAGASLDRKSTTKGCQFFGCRLISWQCKKQTIIVILSTEAEYVAAASCYAQNIVAIKQVNDVTRLQALVDKKKVVVTEAAIEIEEEGDEEEHVEDVTAGDAAQGDDTAAHGEVPTLKRRVKKLEKGNRVRVLKLRRLKRVGTSQRIDTSNDTVMDDESNQGRIIDEMNKDYDVALMYDKKDEEAKVVENDQVQGRQAESQAEIYRIDMDHASKVLSMQEDEPVKVQEVVDVVTTAKLITKVVTAASETVTAASTIISAAELQVPAAIITVAPAKVAIAPSRRRKGVVEIDEEYARNLHAEHNKDIDWDVVTDHVKLKAKEDVVVQRYQAMKRKPQTEAQAQKNMMMYLKNVAGFRLDYFKGMSYDDIRPIFEAKFNSNIEFLLKTKEQIEEESRALQTINEIPAQKATKRRILNKEVEDLKRHLEIMPDEDDDVYTEATPLARKQCLKNQMDKLKSGKIKGLYMVKQRSRAGSYWNHVLTLHEITALHVYKDQPQPTCPYHILVMILDIVGIDSIVVVVVIVGIDRIVVVYFLDIGDFRIESYEGKHGRSNEEIKFCDDGKDALRKTIVVSGTEPTGMVFRFGGGIMAASFLMPHRFGADG
nr:hypothetical protein [Tanacetum cinerariifolium]